MCEALGAVTVVETESTIVVLRSQVNMECGVGGYRVSVLQKERFLEIGSDTTVKALKTVTKAQLTLFVFYHNK